MRWVGRRGRRWRRLLYLLLTPLMVWGGAELLLRWGGAELLQEARGESPHPEGLITLRGNPYLLWEYAPGDRFELGVAARINRLGLRGAEWSIPKPPGQRRILATGDSSVYGYGVGDQEVFLQQLAHALQGESEGALEGCNLAIPGYSSFQTLNLMELRGWQLEPDLLIIANLWSDNNFDSFVDRELLSSYASWEETMKGQLRLRLQRSAVFSILDYLIRVRGGREAERRKVGWTVGGEPGRDRRVALEDYQENLHTLASRARQRGAELVFLVLPNREDVLQGAPAPGAWEPYREALRQVAELWEAPTVEGPEVFLRQGESAESLFLDAMHPSALGHRVLAEALSEELRDWAQGASFEQPLQRDPTLLPRREDPYAGRGPLSPED